MKSTRKHSSSAQCLNRTRSHKILALVPALNACSDDGSASEDEPDFLQPPVLSDSIISSDAPSLDSSFERLNLLDSSESSSNESVNDTFVDGVLVNNTESSTIGDIPLTPVLNEVFPSTSKTNYDVLPSIDSVQSMPTPSAPEYSPYPSLNTPLTRLQMSRNKRKKVVPKVTAKKVEKTRLVLNFKWLKTTLKNRGLLDENLYNVQNMCLGNALNYLNLFLSPDIIEYIVHNTNLYSVQNTGKSIQLSSSEFNKFLGIEIIMGIIKMPAYTDYWARKTRYPLIADEMPLKRYQQIRRNIHFVDNSLPNTDRYFKIRPVMEKIRQNFLKIEEEAEYSVDEMMIPYKGTKAGNRRQYIQNKPKKWGFKNFVRAGVSGLIYDFIIYGGEDTFRGYSFTDAEVSTGVGGKIVIALCKTIKKKPAIIFADNYFTSPELVYILRSEYGIFSLGTIRNNRLRGCQNLLPSDKDMKKKSRGNSAQIVCNKNNLAVVKWSDSKVVTFISSYMDSHPIETIKRFSKESRSKVDVPCPQVVKQYNKHMGGVDLADMFIALYRIPFKSRRWYLGIFAQLIDMCINNAWILYRREEGKNKTALKHFRLEICEGLCRFNRTVVVDESGENLSKRQVIQKPVKARPTDCIRYDNVGHVPEIGEKTVRCRYCKEGRTTIFCIKCDMPLCIVAGERKKRNCFRQFHTK